MTIFIYVKTHKTTGLKYLGKTCKQDPHKYTGSGTYWKKHLKKHGKDYDTEIVGEFDSEDLCTEFCLKFSKENDIVNSTEWANLQEENGTDGAPFGHAPHKFTEEQKLKISESSRKRWQNPEYRKNTIKSQSLAWSEERKSNQSKRLTGSKKPAQSRTMKGRKLYSDHPFCIGIKTDEHKLNISNALKGKPKSEEHKQKLRKPKVRVCRLIDKKEMSINHYTRWLNSLVDE